MNTPHTKEELRRQIFKMLCLLTGVDEEDHEETEQEELCTEAFMQLFQETALSCEPDGRLNSNYHELYSTKPEEAQPYRWGYDMAVEQFKANIIKLTEESK